VVTVLPLVMVLDGFSGGEGACVAEREAVLDVAA
jgi:hypothetical protein